MRFSLITLVLLASASAAPVSVTNGHPSQCRAPNHLARRFDDEPPALDCFGTVQHLISSFVRMNPFRRKIENGPQNDGQENAGQPSGVQNAEDSDPSNVGANPNQGRVEQDQAGPSSGLEIVPFIGPQEAPPVSPRVDSSFGLNFNPFFGPQAGPSSGLPIGPSAGPQEAQSVGAQAGPSSDLQVGPYHGPQEAPPVSYRVDPSLGLNFGPLLGDQAGPSSGLPIGPSADPEEAPFVVPQQQEQEIPSAGPQQQQQEQEQQAEIPDANPHQQTDTPSRFSLSKKTALIALASASIIALLTYSGRLIYNRMMARSAAARNATSNVTNATIETISANPTTTFEATTLFGDESISTSRGFEITTTHDATSTSTASAAAQPLEFMFMILSSNNSETDSVNMTMPTATTTTASTTAFLYATTLVAALPNYVAKSSSRFADQAYPTIIKTSVPSMSSYVAQYKPIQYTPIVNAFRNRAAKSTTQANQDYPTNMYTAVPSSSTIAAQYKPIQYTPIVNAFRNRAAKSTTQANQDYPTIVKTSAPSSSTIAAQYKPIQYTPVARATPSFKPVQAKTMNKPTKTIKFRPVKKGFVTPVVRH